MRDIKPILFKIRWKIQRVLREKGVPDAHPAIILQVRDIQPLMDAIQEMKEDLVLVRERARLGFFGDVEDGLTNTIDRIEEIPLSIRSPFHKELKP